MASRIEGLTQNFYDWERRGRGYAQWPWPVRLEPPFRPFFGHLVVSPLEVLDDGRQPTLFSRIADWLTGRGEPPRAAAPVSNPEIAEPEPVYAEADSDITEIAFALPESTRIDRDAAEAFLISLSACGDIAGFEIISSREKIVVQWVARDADHPHVVEELRTFFPTAGLGESRDFLTTSWHAAPGEVAITECALAREFMLPLRTFLRADPDPLLGTIGALGSISHNEIAILQVLFEPVRCAWAESVKRAVTDWDGSPFFLDAPEITSLGLEKITHPLFAAVLRIAARASHADRAESIVRRVGASLSHFGRADGNELVLVENESGTNLEDDLLTRTSHRSGMLLSVGELLAIVHPLSSSVLVPKLVRRVATTKPAPVSKEDSRAIVLGVNEHAGRSVPVRLPAEQRMRHIHIIGASGTGKSSLLLDLILQTIALREGVAVIDPHGDLVDEVLARVPQTRLDDVVLIDAADAEHPVGFNLLRAHSELERTLLASDLVAIFKRLSTTWGDQMHSVLANAIQAFLTSSRGGSLADLRRFLIEQDFRRDFLTTVQDEEVVYYWTKEFPLLVGKPAGPILTRLDGFLRPKPLRAMLAQRESRLDFREILDSQRILLVKLAQGAIGEENSALLGSLVVAKLHQAAISRQELPPEQRREFTLVVDELQEVVTPSLGAILSGTRKYRLGLVAAHQAMRPVYDADSAVANALLANAATRILFRLGDDDARKLADGFASFDAQALTSLAVGEAICRIDRADHDFNLRTRVLAPLDPEVAADRRTEITRRSRSKYGLLAHRVRGNRPQSAASNDQPAATNVPEEAGRQGADRLKELLDSVKKDRSNV